MPRPKIDIHVPDAREDREIAAGIAEDPDTFVPSDDQWRNARKRGRPKAVSPKVRVSIRLSQTVIEEFKAGGKGWQGRIDEALKLAVEAKKRA